MADLSIGELARRVGVKVPTIRYYEEVGLLPVAPRTSGRQRRYDEAAASRLDFIRHARTLGFTLEAVRELLALSEKPDRPCAEIDHIARRHVEEIDRRIAQLSALRAELRISLEACGKGNIAECRVIDALAHPKS